MKKSYIQMKNLTIIFVLILFNVCAVSQTNISSVLSMNQEIEYKTKRPQKIVETTIFYSSNGKLIRQNDKSTKTSDDTKSQLLYSEELSIIDLTNCTQLQTLNSWGGRLTRIDLSDCMQLKKLEIEDSNLTELDVTNCTQLSWLNCSRNLITKLDITNCTQLYNIICSSNKLAELELTGLNNLDRLWCSGNHLTKLDLTSLNKIYDFTGSWQSVSLSLFKNNVEEYIHYISLNNPTFGNSAISYSDGILKSTDNTVASTFFFVQTNKPDYVLSGTMHFDYSNVGINDLFLPEIVIYPNPTRGEFSVFSYQFAENNNGINPIVYEIFDIAGRIVHRVPCTVNRETVEVDISHLPSGIYFIKIDTEQGIITKKIVKQ